MCCSHKIDIVAHFKSSWQASLMRLTAGLFVVGSSSFAPIVDSAPRDIWTPVGQLS